MMYNKKTITQICLIDSDPICTFLNQKLIGCIDAGIQVVPVNNPEKAIDYLRGLKTLDHTLVLLDVCMPSMSGFELLDTLCSHRQQLPSIAVLTASIHERDRKKVTDYPFLLSYVEKPLTVEKYHYLLQLAHAA